MPKFEAIRGIFKTFMWLTKEDWNEMDHKLLRIATGAIVFVLMALFWFYFLRNIAPFGF